MIDVEDIIHEGEVKKFLVSIDPIDELSMDDYEFEVIAKARKEYRITKSEAVRYDKDNYYIFVDTTKTGKGPLMLKVIAQIPDSDYPGNNRPAIDVVNTGKIVL